MKYKGSIRTVTTEFSETGDVISVSENISAKWEKMERVININVQQQQQQQSSKEDSPDGA